MSDQFGLGRRPATDTRHLERYSLVAEAIPAEPTPVVLGIDWFTGFDKAGLREFDGGVWIGRSPLGTVRGGHAICLKPPALTDPEGAHAHYNQGSEGACFPAGTLVRLADGTHKPINDIRLFDRVLTAEGNVGIVTQTMARWHDAGLAKLRLHGHARVKMTPEHPVLTATGYVPASDLRRGDLVCLTRASFPEPVDTLATEAVVAVNERGRGATGSVNRGGVMVETKALPQTLRLTAQLGRLFGLYLAEGSAHNQKVVWSFSGDEERTLVAETIGLLREELGAEGRPQPRSHNSINVNLYGTHWVRLFDRLLGTGSGNKGVSPHLGGAPDAFRRAMLEGWLAGDGHRRRTCVEGITVSPRLAHDMWAIALDLGLFPTIGRSNPSVNPHAKTRRERWSVTIPEGNGTRPHMDDQGVWRKVLDTGIEPWQGWVYNLDISGDHSYVANGVGVHNCVGFAWSRASSLAEQRLFDGFSLYNRAKQIDAFPGENYSGTEVRAGGKVCQTEGLWLVRGGKTSAKPSDRWKIGPYFWASSVEQIAACLKLPAGQQYVEFLNSWGASYPYLTRIAFDLLHDLLFGRGGDAAVAVNLPRRPGLPA